MENKSTAPKPFIFVLMPFSQKFNDIYKFGIKGAADEVGAYAERVDEQYYTEGILERICNQIYKADVIVADMTGQNPNVFYEVGYAHSLGKIVLLLTQNADDIPFDLRHRPHIVYGGEINNLRTQLAPRLAWAITESRKQGTQGLPERFEVSIEGNDVLENTSLEESPLITVVMPRNYMGNPFVSLCIFVRNTSIGISEAINHIYLFSRQNPVLQPSKVETYTATSAGGLGYPVGMPYALPLSSLKAAAVDSVDGLTSQYKLYESVESLPHGAVDNFTISLLFSGFEEGQSSVEEPFRLRLYSKHTFHDFPFRVKAIPKVTLHN